MSDHRLTTTRDHRSYQEQRNYRDGSSFFLLLDDTGIPLLGKTGMEAKQVCSSLFFPLLPTSETFQLLTGHNSNVPKCLNISKHGRLIPISSGRSGFQNRSTE